MLRSLKVPAAKARNSSANERRRRMVASILEMFSPVDTGSPSDGITGKLSLKSRLTLNKIGKVAATIKVLSFKGLP
jgi:hypothetical protein